ncbi:MAG: hypothetical protein QOE70_6835 [Chthoniobacter sp.]|jgi:hypothetical protein|nr:hypothetical protein [Chthoniobacter sp.]
MILIRFAFLVALLLLPSALPASVEFIPPELRGAVQPQVAVSPAGRIHVVFGKGNAVYHTASADGRSFSTPVKVGELEKLALRMRRGPRVSATNELIAVTAISHADGNLHAWTSADGGATWTETPQINVPASSAREGLHALAGDGRGLVAVAWLDHRGSGTELWSRVSRDGGRNWQPEARVYASPDGHICECCHPSLAIGPRGEIAAMWRNWLGGSRDLWLAVSTDAGATFGAAEKIGVGTWRLNGCPMDGGAVTFGPTGLPFAVWRREKTVFASEHPDTEQRLADGAAQPVVAVGGAEAVVVWEQNGDLFVRRGKTAPERLAERAAAPAIAKTPDGKTVVVWESSAGGAPSLRAEILPPAGQP